MNNKIKKSIVSLIIYAAIGFGVGFLWAFLGDIAKHFGINIGLPEVGDFFIRYIVVFQGMVGTILAIISFYNYLSVKKMVNVEMQDDDVDEKFTQKIDSKQDKALTIGSANYIISFALFGIAIDDRNIWILGSVLVFMAFVAINFFLEISIINQVKQRDPMKKGDPLDTNFEEQWIRSCDEAEKLMIFKAAYKSFQLMKIVLIVAMIVMFFSKVIFKTGNAPIILISVLWLIQIISYVYYGTKIQKGNLNI